MCLSFFSLPGILEFWKRTARRKQCLPQMGKILTMEVSGITADTGEGPSGLWVWGEKKNLHSTPQFIPKDPPTHSNNVDFNTLTLTEKMENKKVFYSVGFFSHQILAEISKNKYESSAFPQRYFNQVSLGHLSRILCISFCVLRIHFLSPSKYQNWSWEDTREKMLIGV